MIIELKGLDKALDAIDPRKVKQAARMAINDSARFVNAEAKREIRKKWNIKAAKLNAEMKNVKFATNADLSAVISAVGRPISLIYFGAKQYRGKSIRSGKGVKILKRSSSKSGVFVKILKSRQTHLPEAFLAKTKNGYVGVFQRSGWKRLPIENRATVSIPSMFKEENVMSVVVKSIESRFGYRFVHHIDRLTGPSGG